MRLSAHTLKALKALILGDDGKLPYRSGYELAVLFQRHGWHGSSEDSIPSRPEFVNERLNEINGHQALRSLIEEVLDPRCYFESGSSPDLVAQRLNRYLEYDGHHLNREGLFYKVRKLSAPIVEPKTLLVGVDEEAELAIHSQLAKCRSKLESEDYEGVITNARTLLEKVLLWLEKELSQGPCSSYSGDLPKLYKRVNKLLNLEPDRKDLSDSLKQILRGFVSIIDGLAGVRNMMSDAHAGSYTPYEHHARLAVNSAHTLVDFLFGTYSYQAAKGLLKVKKKRPVSLRHSPASRSPDRE